MSLFINKIIEIKNVFIQFKIIETILDSIIILLVVFLAFLYMGSRPGWWLLLGPATYFIISLKYRIGLNIVKLIEERYPALKERLSTLYDNREEKNIIVEDLTSSVLADMERVKYSSFISTNLLGIRIVVILILVTLLLSNSISLPSMEQQKGTISSESLSAKNKQDAFNEGSGIDILNEPNFVEIGGDSEGLIVYRGSGSELNEPGEVKQVSGYSQLFPFDVPSSDLYSEGIPVIYQDIVKNYFSNLSTLE